MSFTEDAVPDQTGKVVIVTGGNSGIGKETCRVLLAKGAKVYLAARSKDKAEEAINDIKKATGKEGIVFLPLDLQDLSSVKAATQIFLANEEQLHQLYNNAGIMAVPYGVTKDGYESQFGTNVVGHFALTKLLLPILESTASKTPPGSVRVINLSSGMHGSVPPGGIAFDDLHLTNGSYWNVEWKRYGQAKLGNILFSNELARRYGSKGIYSLSIHPGVVRTNLMSGTSMSQSWIGSFFGNLASRFFVSPAYGCLTQLYAGTSPEVVEKNLNGSYFVPYGKVQAPSAYGQSAELGSKLWDYLEKEASQKGI